MNVPVLFKSSLKSVLRDPLLLFALILPIFMTVLFRFLIPFIAGIVSHYVELQNYYGLIQSILLLMWPMMLGWLGGFLVLDERDEGTLQSVAVTRGGVGFHLLIRFGTILLLGLLLCLGLSPISDLYAIPFLPRLAFVFVNSLLALVYLLMLPAFASNKVEGLVVAKTFGLSMLPAFAVLLPTPYRSLGILFPTYFLTQSVLNVDDLPKFLLYLMGGLIEILLLTLFFSYRFSRDNR
ncbi:hypothetical protein [Spirochaeta cellobiosiphila]|uniref:hypothetical protein n=1 Tax=Spirochaeta cellobiosiphila TaxID=504483 RepID=UPI0004275BDD|nr:hypothetical protein [Spirochaeta cellobiosiphila]